MNCINCKTIVTIDRKWRLENDGFDGEGGAKTAKYNHDQPPYSLLIDSLVTYICLER